MSYTPQTLIEVFPFVRQIDGEEAVIGRPETAVFLVLPKEGLELLDDLAAGKTVGAAQALFHDRHGELPDMDEFLGYLESKGIVRPLSALGQEGGAPSPGTATVPASTPARVRYHFAGIAESTAQRIFSRPFVSACCVVIALGCAAVALDRHVLPGWRALFFTRNLTLMSLLTMAFYYSVLFIHEMAHLLAARAIGVGSRLGISHRLWTLVAETDMSGLWGVPRQRRYLPLLAGPLIDATSAALLILVLFSQRRGWLAIPSGAIRLLPAMLLVYLLSLLWQCFFFVRTDFYFVIANFFNCKNLMGDTEAYLRNRFAPMLPFLRRTDLAHIPAREMRVIRAYSLVWIGGRLAAFSALIFIHIPLVLGYFGLVSSTLAAGYGMNARAYLDALVMATLSVLPLLAGFWLWLRSLARSWSALARSAPG